MNNRPVWTIAKREWSAYFNSPVAYVFIFIFLALMGFFSFSLFQFFRAGNAELSDSFFFWHPWLYLILIPALSMRMWAEERRNHTLELLFTLPATPVQIMLGKFLAGWTFLGLCLVLTFPAVLTVSYLGDPDGGVIAAGYIGSFLLAGAYLATGMLTSSLTRDQVISFIIAVCVGLFLILAGFPPVTTYLSGILPQGVIDVVSGFSFTTHFDQARDGKIWLRDLVYFVSFIGFMLFANLMVLKNRATR